MRFVLTLCALLWTPLSVAQEKVPEAERKRAAVTLNYCRASLSRIRRFPSKRVLLEEQERILNNLNLNAIQDEEVVNLYSAVLDEISQTQIVDHERKVIHEQTRRGMQRKLGTDLFVIGAQVATGSLGGAIQSGANSWWDYRSSVMDREVRTWAVERNKLNGIVSRSSRFLDAAWKLSRKNEIPDHWLVRTDDLVRLEKTMQEPDPEVRLRVLNRMSRFMECYPPYWYYVARTQQRLGMMKQAAETYRRLSDLGNGHFRKDEMLAAGTANLAMIEEFLGLPDAARTAEQALEYSTDAWEVNLTCAWVLNRHEQRVAAEDAILRNLDVELEENQSAIALVSLYYHNQNKEKLARVLEDEKTVARIPIPGLLLCSTILDAEKYPAAARKRIAGSLQVLTDVRFGRDGIAVRTSPDWKLADARVAVQLGERRLDAPRIHSTAHGVEARFAVNGDLGNPLRVAAAAPVVVTLQYPATPVIRIELEPNPASSLVGTTGVDILRPAVESTSSYRISTIQVGDRRLGMRPSDAGRS